MTQSNVPRWRNTPPLWRHLEALLFAGVFVYTTWDLTSGLVHYASATASGEGFITDLLKPFNDGNYHDSVLAIVGLLITLLTLWELVRFFITQAGKERAQGRSPGVAARLFRATALEYQPTFFAGLLLGLLPRLIVIDVFWVLMPYFQHLALFRVGYHWYSWLYAFLIWDLSMWIWHYGAHKVRVLWCLTPSYHRVHHARNPLYMDTNFCSLLPFWDWMFGTLQPLRDEVKIEYGITRECDVTSFVDFYFGELLLLARDVRRAPDWRTRLAYLFKPPGWEPGDDSHTAASAKRNFLADHPELRPVGAPALLARLLPRRVAAA